MIARLEGQLTATLHLDADDEPPPRALMPLLAAQGRPRPRQRLADRRRGHPRDGPRRPVPGDPDGRSTSVGTLAIDRFLRPVCFQDLPAALLPPALAEGNAWGVARRIDGQREASRA